MPLSKGKSDKSFKKNVEIEMDAGKPQKQALAIAYAVKRRAKMAKGGIMFQCPDCLNAQSKCAVHADAKPEAHLDNEAKHKFFMDFASRDKEPGLSDDTSGSPTMDRAVRASHPMSVGERLMQKRKDRGSSVGRYSKGGYAAKDGHEDGPEMDRPIATSPDHFVSESDTDGFLKKDEPEGSMSDLGLESFASPEMPDAVNEDPAMRDEDRDARHMASGGYLDPNKPQSIESQIPPYEPEGEDRSEDLDKVHPNDSSPQSYSDMSEDDIDPMHDYSLLPSQDDSTNGSRHDSDDTDIAQQNSLVGQLMAKRKRLKARH